MQLLRFKVVECHSKICFTGKKKRVLKYAVRSIALIPYPPNNQGARNRDITPEIFWQ